MEMKDMLLILFPIIAGIVSSYITYYFAIKSKKNEAILEFKEEKYANLVVLLQGFTGKTASGDTKRKFLEEQRKSWLYCSDEVIKAVNNMLILFVEKENRLIDNEKAKEAIGNIIVAIRKDLLGKTKLDYTDFSYFDVIDR